MSNTALLPVRHAAGRVLSCSLRIVEHAPPTFWRLLRTMFELHFVVFIVCRHGRGGATPYWRPLVSAPRVDAEYLLAAEQPSFSMQCTSKEHKRFLPPSQRRLFDLQSRQWRQLPVRGMSPLPRFLFGYTQYSPPGGGADQFVLFGGQTGAAWGGVGRRVGAVAVLLGHDAWWQQNGWSGQLTVLPCTCFRGWLQAERRVAAQPGQQPVAAAVAALLHLQAVRAHVWLRPCVLLPSREVCGCATPTNPRH